MTQDQNSSACTDTLLARYHAAQATLDAPEASGPSAQTRANILDYALKIATNSVASPAIKQRDTVLIDTKSLATNDSHWKIRALATVALFGLTSLLLLQWDRGTPEEKEVAFSTARPPEAARSESTAAPAAAPSPAPTVAPSSPPAIIPPKADAPTNTAKAIVPVAPARARDRVESEAGQASASGTLSKAAPISAKDEAAVAQAIAPPAAQPPQTVAPAPEAAAPAARAPALRAAPAPGAAEYGAAASARRDDTPSAAARLKKADAPDAATSMQDKSATATGSPAPVPNAALFAAIRSADALAVQQALVSGADKNAKRNGTPAITLCVQANQPAMVRLLASAGADLNIADAQGMTPLAHAQSKGVDEMVKLLLELGAK